MFETKVNRQDRKNLKAQGSIEYISMIALALILVAIALAVIFLLGSKTTSGVKVSGTIEGAEFNAGSNQTFTIAISEPLEGYDTIVAINGINLTTVFNALNPNNKNFTVGGSYEYQFKGSPTPAYSNNFNTLSSLTFQNSAGIRETYLTSTGKPIPIVDSTLYPFTPIIGLTSG